MRKGLIGLIMGGVLLLQLATPSKAQVRQTSSKASPCALKKERSPRLRSFYLGQPLEEIQMHNLRMLHDQRRREDTNGDLGYVMLFNYELFPDGYPRQANGVSLEDVSVALHFLDEKLALIS